MRLLFLFVASILSVPSHALEPWADPALPAKDGLEVWLDARAQNAARTARKLPHLADGQIESWLDGSGNRRDVRQPLPDARPRLVTSAGAAFVRFDGKDDFFSATPGMEVKEATIFVVAAPRGNAGAFRAFFAMNRAAQNDYTTGLNLDLGGKGSPTLSFINAEGAGAGGERNLLKTQFDFGTFHTFTLTADAKSLRLRADGSAEGSRSRKGDPIGMDELTIAARNCANDGRAAYANGFLEGDIAELIIYRRALPDAERDAVEKYLTDKHGGLRALTGEKVPGGLRPLIPVKDPPPVQMLVPGFEVRELPLKLTNINCLRYRHDGVLVAGAYNGKIWLLRDTDGDGSEDKADLFWESADLNYVIGMDVTRKDDPRGPGVFVATAGRILFIPDKNGDDRGDEQRVIASGWEKQQSPGGGGSVDALGLVVGPEGSVYFGLGVSAYNNAYLLDADGKSHFDLKTERGTVLRISPDFSKREVVCTGIRYPVGAAFNRHGDLFMTEQEGATWLPNGNPFDELVHIQPGRHYGFPPRHPKHLPNVIDEPSVFDYGPQHQSACGMAFNTGHSFLPNVYTPGALNSLFGPFWWRDDAFVAGESRGKIYRTKLVKTAAGYVAQNQLIACTSMLAVDVALSPRGDLLVACHSGAPDWGTGPEGKGKLFRISSEKLPNGGNSTTGWLHQTFRSRLPVATYFSAPGELRVTFDGELDPARLRDVAKHTEIVAGRYVAAGDRFESFRPGYQVVRDQLAASRRDVPVLGVTLSADKCTVAFSIQPQSAAESYAVTMPDFARNLLRDSARRESKDERAADLTTLLRPDFQGSTLRPGVSNNALIDVATDMSGIEATWVSADGSKRWQGWLPHLDLAVARELTAGSAEHEAFWKQLASPGKLTVRGQINLLEMLQPAIQPGAKLDYERDTELVTLSFECNHGFVVTNLPPGTRLNNEKSGEGVLTLTARTSSERFMSYELVLHTDDRVPNLTATWHTADDPRPRAFPVRRFLMPFAKPATNTSPAAKRIIPEIAGGNWLNGRRLYSGKAQCASCHTIHGEGGRVGPDLSNLAFRDLASVERDIREPSAALNPDHISYHITMKDGAELAAVVLTEDKDKIRIGEATGVVRDLPRSEVRELKALPISLMPPALLDTLTPAERKDVLTFLLAPPPLEPTPIEAKGPPPPRKRAELEAVLNVQRQTSNAQRPMPQTPLRILLVSAKKDHGPGEHDYPLFQKRWSKLLALAEGIEVATAQDWPTVEQLAKTDVAVFYSNNPTWNPDRKKELDAFLQRGGGAVFIHWAIEGHAHADELADCIGLASRAGGLKYRHGALAMTFPNAEHPITRGFKATDFVDETYWQAVGDPARITLLGEAIEDNAPRPQLWAREHGKGRVFVSIPGHYMWTFDDPLHRVLLLRGICWTARQPDVDRLSELTTVGARME